MKRVGPAALLGTLLCLLPASHAPGAEQPSAPAAQKSDDLEKFFKPPQHFKQLERKGAQPLATWDRPIGGYIEIEGKTDSRLFMVAIAVGVLVLNGAGGWWPKVFNAALVRALTSIGVIVICWELITYAGLVTSILLPSPTVVLAKLIKQWERGYVQIHVYYSVRRLLGAFFLAVASGIPLGFLIANFRRFSDYIDPLFNLIRVVPPPAWLPLAILWFGIGDPPSIYIIWLGAFFPILLNTIRGVKNTQQIHVESILNLGGTRLDVFRRVMLPSAFPTIVTGIRVGFGIGWICLVTAELVAVDAGLGWMIEDARTLLDTPTVLGGMVLISALGIIFDVILRKAEAAIVRW
jgi:ABC-type nitrate/sulfonate/bicarbonate transport system permease component